MKTSKKVLYPALLVTCIALVVTVWIFAHRESLTPPSPVAKTAISDVTKKTDREGPTPPSPAARTAVSAVAKETDKVATPASTDDLSAFAERLMKEQTSVNFYNIRGTVKDVTPESPEKNLAALNDVASGSEKEFEQILGKMIEPRPASGAVVTLTGMSIEKREVANSQGRFQFAGLPDGMYEIAVEMPSRMSWSGTEQAVQSKQQVRLNQDATVHMEIRTDRVSLKGRIIDSNGHPVAGAKVNGSPYPMPEEGQSAEGYTVTTTNDGTFELRGFSPPDVYHIAGFLNGGRPGSDSPFYADIHVKSEGYVQEAPCRVPLVTEELLVPARRVLNAMTKLKGGAELGEKNDVNLPASHGNVIKEVDIVLRKAGTGA